MKPTPINRRQFVRQSGCAALGTTGLFSTLLNLGLATRVMAADEQSDYKAMICIFLLGGNDSYNMLVPTNSDEYAYYLNFRGGLYDADKTPNSMGIGAPGSGNFSLLPIQPSNTPGRGFGLHPSMAESRISSTSSKALPSSPTSARCKSPMPMLPPTRATLTATRSASSPIPTSSSSGRPACRTGGPA